MTTGQIILLAIMGILTVIFYLRGCYSIVYKTKPISGILSVAGLMFISLISLAIFIIVLEENTTLKKIAKEKCPEYEKIDNVYRLKQ